MCSVVTTSRTFAHCNNLRTVRCQAWPLRHQIRMLLRQRQQLLGPEALSGFQDMGELVELLFDSTELLRSQCDAITRAYAASAGNRMNQVMKMLAILTSIFAPLTFIAGIYGMNFEFMPELHWRHGYTLVLLVMVLAAILQAWLLWRRGWFADWTTPRSASSITLLPDLNPACPDGRQIREAVKMYEASPDRSDYQCGGTKPRPGRIAVRRRPAWRGTAVSVFRGDRAYRRLQHGPSDP